MSDTEQYQAPDFSMTTAEAEHMDRVDAGIKQAAAELGVKVEGPRRLFQFRDMVRYVGRDEDILRQLYKHGNRLTVTRPESPDMLVETRLDGGQSRFALQADALELICTSGGVYPQDEPNPDQLTIADRRMGFTRTPTPTELRHRFSYHPPKTDQPAKYEHIRAKARELAEAIAYHCPPSDETARALDRLDEAVFTANAAIARHS